MKTNIMLVVISVIALLVGTPAVCPAIPIPDGAISIGNQDNDRAFLVSIIAVEDGTHALWIPEIQYLRITDHFNWIALGDYICPPYQICLISGSGLTFIDRFGEPVPEPSTGYLALTLIAFYASVLGWRLIYRGSLPVRVRS